MLTRRSLLQGASLGVGLLTMPRFLAGCAPHGGAALGPTQDPFLDWFGIDEPIVSRLLAELTRNGASFADVYFQHSRVNSVTLEDGIISRASTSIDQGVGLRVVVGDQTGFAFTEDLTPESMLAAARTAAAIARGAPLTAPTAFTRPAPNGDLYQVAVPWSDIGVDAKLPMLSRLEALARAQDPSVGKVSISWVDEDSRVLVADSAGRMLVDRRPGTRLWCNVTATKNGNTLSNSANVAGRQGIEWYTDARLAEIQKLRRRQKGRESCLHRVFKRQITIQRLIKHLDIALDGLRLDRTTKRPRHESRESFAYGRPFLTRRHFLLRLG